MDARMPVSRERIKALRDARAWSQAHLAEAAGLSLRTVQRVEAEGVASAETRLALAAALDVPVESLNAPQSAAGAAMAPGASPSATPAHAREPEPDQVPNAARVTVFAVSGAGIVFALGLGSGLPPLVASHFGAAGDANGWMSRDHFVAIMGGMLGLLPLALQTGLVLALRFGGLNIPNKRYWLAPARRAAAVRSLHAHVAWLCVGLSAFLAWLFWQVAAANRESAAHPALHPHAMTMALAVLLVAMTAWVGSIGHRFRRGSPS
jgi:transcriptional regulator with XRE-family HTH domain